MENPVAPSVGLWRRGFWFSPRHTLTAHCWWGSDPGTGMQSVALKFKRHYFSIVNDLISQDQKIAFILTV